MAKKLLGFFNKQKQFEQDVMENGMQYSSFYGDSLRRLKKNKMAMFCACILILLALMAIFAPLLAPYDPTYQDYSAVLGGPCKAHPFGTDEFGRDILSRIIYGSRVSMIVAVGATIVGAIIGVLIGLTAGYFGGWIDSVLMRVMDGMFSFPFILLAMILITVLGNGVMNVILAIGIASVPGFARVTRGQVLIVKEEEYCNACRVVGVSPVRLLFLHILPNCVSQIIVYATLRIASAIISEASLSFLGLGIALPTASWGSILRVGRDCLTTAPHVAGTAGAFILVTVIGFNLLGDGIRDVMDPKMKQ